jgi:hypothetical protein
MEQETIKETKPQKNKTVLKVYSIDENPSKRLFKNFLNNEILLKDYLENNNLIIGKNKDGQPIKATIKNPVLSSMEKLTDTIKDDKIKGRWEQKRFNVVKSKWNTYKKENSIKV